MDILMVGSLVTLHSGGEIGTIRGTGFGRFTVEWEDGTFALYDRAELVPIADEPVGEPEAAPEFPHNPNEDKRHWEADFHEVYTEIERREDPPLSAILRALRVSAAHAERGAADALDRMVAERIDNDSPTMQSHAYYIARDRHEAHTAEAVRIGITRKTLIAWFGDPA